MGLLGGLGNDCEQAHNTINCRNAKENGRPLPNVNTTGDTCDFLIEKPTSQDVGLYRGYIHGSPEPDLEKYVDLNYLKCEVIGIKQTCIERLFPIVSVSYALIFLLTFLPVSEQLTFFR